MQVIALDPGGTTGWARFVAPSEEYVFQLLNCGEVELWHGLDTLIRRGDIVVSEELQSLHPSFSTVGIEVTGVIKYLCELNEIELHIQKPGVINAVQRWGIFQEVIAAGKTQHEIDAICHGLAFIRKNFSSYSVR